MNKRLAILLAVAAGAILLAVVAYLVIDRQHSPGGPAGDRENTPFKEMYPDAPNPADDPELAEQIKNLWPDVFKPKPDREMIRREWADFAKKYPDNIYIPDEFRAPISDEQREERQKVLDTVSAVDTRFANMRAEARNAQPGQDGPAAPGQPAVSAAEQKVYFDYKIQELQSRMQLVQYMLENGNPDAEQRASAQKELQTWNAQLENYKKLKSSIPGN